MQITYPSHHRWLRDISAGVDIGVSGRIVKLINQTIPLLGANGIEARIEPLSEDFFVDFTPQYIANIASKENAMIHDVMETTLLRPRKNSIDYGFSLYEKGSYIGGTIFSLRSKSVSYAYRTFQKNWNEAKLSANPALIAEHMVAEFGRNNGKHVLSHGKDRNPYGLNSAIGMAGFKLSVGCSPFNLTGTYDINILDTTSISKDCLVLEQPQEGTAINKAYLITSKETEHKYLQITKYPDQLLVEVLYRD